MKNVEIERKYLIKKSDLPKNLNKYSHDKISQGFIYLKPAIRIRQYGNKYFFTVKSLAPKSLNSNVNDLARIEYEIEIDKKAYKYLSKFVIGNFVVKERYKIPYGKYLVELDIFEKELKGLIYAEVEFKSIKSANTFNPPNWFYRDVTGIDKYKNTSLSVCKNIEKLISYNK